MSQPNLQDLLNQCNTRKPPVEQWQPPVSGDMDMRIDWNGHWYHEGQVILRQPLVKLFSSILRRDVDNEYYLVTPVECWRIQVDDVPFIAVELQCSQDDNGLQQIFLRTQVDDWIRVGHDHPIKMTPKYHPYVRVRGRLWARLARSVYYELADYAVKDESGRYGVFSQGNFFVLEAGAEGA